MFSRHYALRSFSLGSYDVDSLINATIAEFDRPDACASVAAMSSTNEDVHILIEYWKSSEDTSNGDAVETPTRTVEPAATGGQRRRRAASAHDHGRAAARVEPAGQRQSVGAAKRLKEEDVPLPFAVDYYGLPPKPYPSDTPLLKWLKDKFLDQPVDEPEIEWPTG